MRKENEELHESFLLLRGLRRRKTTLESTYLASKVRLVKNVHNITPVARPEQGNGHGVGSPLLEFNDPLWLGARWMS